VRNQKARNNQGTCLQHPCNYGDDPVALRCWQGEAWGVGPAGWPGCLAAPAVVSGFARPVWSSAWQLARISGNLQFQKRCDYPRAF
jgi:hypothetical protein